MPDDPPKDDAPGVDDDGSRSGDSPSAPKGAPTDPAASGEDDDGEGEDAAVGDPTSDDGEAASDGTRAERPRKKKRKKKRKKEPLRALPRSEAEIDAPTKQSLFMVGALASLTLVLWGSAKFACNAHPPQSRAPKPADITRMTKTPKDAAIEVQQRIALSDYETAAKLVAGELAAELAPKAKACEGGACAQKITELSRRVMTTGTLLDATTDGSAKVRVLSHGLEDAKPYLVDLRFADGGWKAVRRVIDDGTYRPPSVPAAPSPSPDAAPAPSASATPPASAPPASVAPPGVAPPAPAGP